MNGSQTCRYVESYNKTYNDLLQNRQKIKADDYRYLTEHFEIC